MAFFKSRLKIKGLYLLDEPETALSPKTQLALLSLLKEISQTGIAQFIIATHSPILLACPEARILTFDEIPVKPIAYEKPIIIKFTRALWPIPISIQNQMADSN